MDEVKNTTIAEQYGKEIADNLEAVIADAEKQLFEAANKADWTKCSTTQCYLNGLLTAKRILQHLSVEAAVNLID
jgi:ribosomal protein L18